MSPRVLDLFAGTGSATQPFADAGWERVTVELDPDHSPDLVADVAALTADDLPGPWDFVWASPPCTAFSILGAYRNWRWQEPFHAPKSVKAVDGIALFAHTRRLIEELQPSWWLVENPVGIARNTVGVWLFSDVRRYTVTYCAYGHPWRKPTDLWGAAPPSWLPRPQCSPGDPCHEAKPSDNNRRTGTFGAANARERSRLPHDLGESLRLAAEGQDDGYRTEQEALDFGGAA